jgi:outer membrane protein
MFVLQRAFLICLLVLYAAQGYALSLEEALIAVYKDSPVLQAHREQLKIADENIMAALSRWLPDARISLIQQYNHQIRPEGYSLVPNSTNTGSVVGVVNAPNRISSGTVGKLTIGQNIYRSGADIAAIRSARSAIKAASAQLTAQEQQLLFEVVSTYMEALQYYESYKIAQEQESDTEKTLVGSRQKVAVGIVTKTDLAQIEANFAKAQADSIAFKARYESAKAKLESLVGFKVHNLDMPKDIAIMPKSVNEVIETALVGNPQIDQAKYSAEAAKFSVDTAKGSVLPQVDLSYVIDDNSKNKNAVAAKRNRTTQLSLTIPVMNVSGWSDVRTRKRVSAQMIHQLQSVKDSIRASATAAWVELEASKAVLKANRNAYEAMKLAYTGKKAIEKVGLLSVLDMIEIRRSYFRIYNDFIRSKAAYYVNMYYLKSIIGECTAKGLGLNVPLYDPLKNYNAIKWQVVGAF